MNVPTNHSVSITRVSISPLAQLQAHKVKLDEKIEFYKTEMERINSKGAVTLMKKQ